MLFGGTRSSLSGPADPPEARVVSSILCKRFSGVGRSRQTLVSELPIFRSVKPCATALAGDAQGGGSPLVGGAGARCVPALFAGPAACQPAWGEPSRPGLPPEGETGKGAIRFLAAAGEFLPWRLHSLYPHRSPVQGRLNALAPEHLEVVHCLLPMLDRVPLGAHVPQCQIQQLYRRILARE